MPPDKAEVDVFEPKDSEHLKPNPIGIGDFGTRNGMKLSAGGRLPRFGLGALLAAVAVVAVPAAWWSSLHREAQIEQAVIARVRGLHRVVEDAEPVEVNSTLGGFVEFEYAWCGPHFLRRWSKSLPQFERVVGVLIVMEHVDTRTTALLSRFRRLRSVFLQDVPRAKEIAAEIHRLIPKCEIKSHPDWEVTLPE